MEWEGRLRSTHQTGKDFPNEISLRGGCLSLARGRTCHVAEATVPLAPCIDLLRKLTGVLGMELKMLKQHGNVICSAEKMLGRALGLEELGSWFGRACICLSLHVPKTLEAKSRLKKRSPIHLSQRLVRHWPLLVTSNWFQLLELRLALAQSFQMRVLTPTINGGFILTIPPCPARGFPSIRFALLRLAMAEESAEPEVWNDAWEARRSE
eukprot:s4782_g3.t1